MMKNRNLIKWLARIIGLFSSSYFLIFHVGNIIPEIISQQDRTSTSVLFLLLFTIAGYIFAWFKEREGGTVMIFGGLISGMYLFYQDATGNTMMAIIYALPFLIPGLLFYWYSTLSNKKE